MIYLLYGQDTYRSRENLKNITERFLGERGAAYNFFRFSPDNFQKNIFLDMCHMVTMLGGKYLTVLENIVSDKNFQAVILDNLDLCANSDNVFIFWEEDLKDDITEQIKTKAKKTQKFDPLSGVKLKRWIEDRAHTLHCKIDPDDVKKLMDQYGPDLWALSAEIELIALGHVPDFSGNASEENSPMFDLTDAFISRNKKQAVVLFEKYKNAGVPAEDIFWKILWQVKTLLAVKTMSEKSPTYIQKQTGLHPFVVKKSLEGVARFSLNELDKIAARLIEIFQQSRIGLIDLEANLMRLFLRL